MRAALHPLGSPEFFIWVERTAVFEGVEADDLGPVVGISGAVSEVVFIVDFQIMGSGQSQYARHSAMPAPQRNPYRLPRPAAIQVGQLKWWPR